jgi:SulP family sulfate permease
VTNTKHARNELRGGIEASIQGISTTIGPILLFTALFGTAGLAAGFWATLITASLIHGVSLLLRGNAALVPSARVASLATYAGLVLHLCTASTAPTDTISLAQLRIGLAAGSLMFLLASLLVLLFGLLRLGNVFKMIPTPVTAGISNGTALLLLSLAVQQLTHTTWVAPLTTGFMIVMYVLWPRWRLAERALAWLPAIVVAIVVGVLLSAVMGSGALAQADVASVVSAAAPAASASSWGWEWMSLLLWPDLLKADSGINAGRLLMIALPGALTLALVMILETFTAAAVMETRFGVGSHANRELLVLGGANLVSAVFGGVPSTVSAIRSVANWTSGGRGRLASFASLLVTCVILLSLGQWLMAMPAGIMAGLLVMQAILMADRVFMRKFWAIARQGQWRSEGIKDLGFWITLTITLVGFFGNLIWACFLGIGLSCLAVLRRVSGSLTAHWVYLDHYRSRRVRNLGETVNLQREFHQVGILRLTGHLFFGNSLRITQLADELHKDAIGVVLDVSQVHEVDSSGLDALMLLIRVLTERKLTVTLTGLNRTRSDDIRRALQAASGVVFKPDMDRGLEACEDLVLASINIISPTEVVHLLQSNRLLQDLSPDEITEVMLLGEQRDVAPGAALFYKDTRADGIWLLETGVVSILTGQDDNATRLATFGPGQFVGEMGFIDGKTRSATAWADTPVCALLLDAAAITALVERQPSAALKITRNIARELSHRVRSSSAMLADETLDSSADWANSSLSTYSRF